MKVVKRIRNILDLFTPETPSLSVLEVAKKLHINRTTVHQLMVNMHSENLLIKSLDNKKYSLSTNFLKWGYVFSVSIDTKAIALPYLMELNKQTKELLVVYTIQNNNCKLVLSIDSQHPVRLVIDSDVDQNGLYSPWHAGAAGKLLLAFLPEEKANKLINKIKLQRFTSNTITNKKMLKEEIKKIRKNGFSLSNQERHEGVWAASAPIRNYTGEVVAAVSIVSIITTHKKNLESNYVPLIKDVADKVSRDLGYELYDPNKSFQS